jgi:hypothetical protein
MEPYTRFRDTTSTYTHSAIAIEPELSLGNFHDRCYHRTIVDFDILSTTSMDTANLTAV